LAGTAFSPVPFRRPFGPDPVQEDGGGFVGGVLRDQAALEGALQDGLTEGGGVHSPIGQRNLHGLGLRDQNVSERQYGKNLLLRRQRKRKGQDDSLTNCVLTGGRYSGPLYV
jgi:hypothetical protein